MHRLLGLSSLGLSLALLAVTVAAAQQRSPQSRLLRSVPLQKVEVARESVKTQAPRRAQEPTQRAAETLKRRTERRAQVDVNRRQESSGRNSSSSRFQASRQGISAILAEFDAQAPFGLSRSRRYLVAAEKSGGGLVLCDVAIRKRLRRLENSQGRYALVEISADARWIAAVPQNDSDHVYLWRADNGRRIGTLDAPGGAKRLLAFSARGDQLRVEARGGDGLVFSIPSGDQVGGLRTGNGGSAARPPTAQAAPRIGAAPKRDESKGVIGPQPYTAPPAAAAPQRESASPTPQREAMSAPPPIASPARPETDAPPAPETTKAAPKKAAKKIMAPGASPPTTSAPAMTQPQPKMSEREPRMAQPEPRMAQPSRSETGEERSGSGPPSAAQPPTPFDNITSTRPEGALEAAPAPAEPEGAPPETAADNIAQPLPAGPAAAGDSTFADRAETAPEAAEVVEGPLGEEDVSRITVHYATNRNRLAPKDREWLVYFERFFFTLPAIVVYALVVLALLVLPWFGKRSWAAYALVTGVVVLCAMGTLEAYVRSQLRDELSGELFGSRPTDISYGACEVSVPLPENRQAGELNRPVSVWVFQAPENPEKHFMLRRVDEYPDKDAFYRSLSARVEKSDARAALLFIHGYNVSFEDAVFRTAQLAVDLKFPGPPVTYSWPSYADPVKYTFDEQNAEVSIAAFREFLKDLATRSGAERIHIIAHSMGNRVLAGAMESMDRESREQNRKVFREVVLAAPDVDRRVFESQVLPHLAENAQHLTLYASSRDRALLISHYFHNYQRLGETEPDLIVTDGMDTIDASLVDTSLLGHSYIGDVQSIVSDLHHLVVAGKRPPDRSGLESLERGDRVYWTIKPALETAADASLRR